MIIYHSEARSGILLIHGARKALLRYLSRPPPSHRTELFDLARFELKGHWVPIRPPRILTNIFLAFRPFFNAAWVSACDPKAKATWTQAPHHRMSTRETRSRLPRVPTATSVSKANGTTSAAVKRSAKAAQLDPEVEQIITRRKEKIEAFTANMNKNSLERRLQDAENAKKVAEAELSKLKLEKVKLEGDRRWLAQREQELLEERENETEAFTEEKVRNLRYCGRGLKRSVAESDYD